MGEWRFGPEDADFICSGGGEFEPGTRFITLERANAKLTEWLRDAKTVYLIHKDDWEPLAWVEGAVISANQGITFTHQAKLVDIKPVEKSDG